MSETLNECLERVKLMSEGNPTWDLSDNDLHALKATLMEIIHLREAVHAATERATKAETILTTLASEGEFGYGGDKKGYLKWGYKTDLEHMIRRCVVHEPKENLL